MANNVLTTLSINVVSVQFASPTETGDLLTELTTSMAAASTLQTFTSSVSATLLSSESVSRSLSPSTASLTPPIVHASASPTTSGANTGNSDGSTNVVMGRANVVTIITLSSVFGTTVLVLLMLLLRNYCKRRRHSQGLQPVTRPWLGGPIPNQKSQSTDKFVRALKEPPKSPVMIQNRPYQMSSRGLPATVRPVPPPMDEEKRSALMTQSPTTTPALSSKEWLAEDVGTGNAGSTIRSGRGGLGRLDRPAPSPTPPFPHSPTPPPPAPPVLLAAPPPRPRPRPRPVEHVPRASRAVGRLQPGGSAPTRSIPSLESVTSERLEQFYAPWVRDMMEQGRREVRVKAVVGQRDPDGRVGLPPPGSTVPRAAGRGG